MQKVKSLKIRPYARLLTMLGEQLIKNERIALIELIKNSYDADAKWVKISFCNFGQNFEIKNNSKIVIEDSGLGMTSEIIEKHWLNPATPEKTRRKMINDTTKKGRIIQGDKGIGRFAIFKLGRKINVTTRAINENIEHNVIYDFSEYDDDFLTHKGIDKDLFIEDLNVTLRSGPPKTIEEREMYLGSRKFIRDPHGTIIEISGLKGSWSENKLADVYRDISRLQSIFLNNSSDFEFEVHIYCNSVKLNFDEKYLEKLHFLLQDRSVLRVENGRFDDKLQLFSFELNGETKEIKLSDPSLSGLKTYNTRFGKAGDVLRHRSIECGPFNFGFYVFDFSPNPSAKYKLDRDDKKILKDHRIYLYRDNIRVYPYGEPEDDWLSIDVSRGTISAGQFLSNDQVVGYVNITQRENPKLKDKTNREGLIDEGEATQDFITLLQSILFFIRKGPYRKYQLDQKSKQNHDIFRTEQVQKEFDELKKVISGNQNAKELLVQVEKHYKAERQYLVQRAETTEELAGVGLSVETASHDIMGIMSKVFANIDGLIQDLIATDEIKKDILLKELQSIRGGMGFIESQLKDIQLLFKSSKQRRKSIRVKEILVKIEKIYGRTLKKEHIHVLVSTYGSPLIAKTTDAVLLQLFLNLFDNSIYWLMQVPIKEKKIEIILDGNKGQMIFADNGPGVLKEDAPYIFEPFFSGKGVEGRGLGLYIARQLLERNDFTIELANINSEKVLPGANFYVSFYSEEK